MAATTRLRGPIRRRLDGLICTHPGGFRYNSARYAPRPKGLVGLAVDAVAHHTVERQHGDAFATLANARRNLPPPSLTERGARLQPVWLERLPVEKSTVATAGRAVSPPCRHAPSLSLTPCADAPVP